MKLKGLFSAAIAFICGTIVMAGYFFRLEALMSASDTLIRWAILLAGFAVLMGIVNLLMVHLGKVVRKQKGGVYSGLLVVAMVVTFALGLLAPRFPAMLAAFDFSFRAIQLPVEKSLMAILAVTLTLAGIRLLRKRLSVFSVLFLSTSLLIMLGIAPLPFLGSTPLVSDTLRPFLTQVMAASGARGILIGVALGALTTGLRVLMGADRPYGGK